MHSGSCLYCGHINIDLSQDKQATILRPKLIRIKSSHCCERRICFCDLSGSVTICLTTPKINAAFFFSPLTNWQVYVSLPTKMWCTEFFSMQQFTGFNLFLILKCICFQHIARTRFYVKTPKNTENVPRIDFKKQLVNAYCLITFLLML